ncbi:MAG: hypothetical protein ACE5IG_06525 [Dehalococcoidia bacterium]
MSRARSAKPLSTHDRKVREIARSLEKQGYKVRADIRGREKPRSIGSKKLVPDIEASRGGRRLVVEVETAASLAKDKEQLKTFARHAGQKANTTLRVVVTKPRKK